MGDSPRTAQTLHLKASPVHKLPGGADRSALQRHVLADPLNRHALGKAGAIQRALATVNPNTGPITLDQRPNPVPAPNTFLVMENLGQPNGQDVRDTVGFAGILDAGSWAGQGKSPRNYWRAHAYANSFGGGGDASNVAWWPATNEDSWTAEEQRVRGGGLNQIAAWKPGVGERGTYNVTRTLWTARDIISKYVNPLVSAANWGMDDARAAWTRTTTWASARANRFPKATLDAAKHGVQGNVATRIGNWVNGLFGGGSVDTNLIRSMTMTYTITNAGATPGASRANLNHTENATNPNASQFGLRNNNNALWTALVNHNSGLFARGGNPLNAFAVTVPSALPHDHSNLELKPHADGWGKDA